MSEEKAQLIQDVSRLQREIFDASCHERFGEWMELDLTLGQLKVAFLLLDRPPTRMGDLAAGLGVSLPACTSLVDRLVRADIVERRADPTHPHTPRARRRGAV